MQTAQRSEAPLPSLKSILCKVKMYNLIHTHTHTHTHTHCIRRCLEQTASLLPEKIKGSCGSDKGINTFYMLILRIIVPTLREREYGRERMWRRLLFSHCCRNRPLGYASCCIWQIQDKHIFSHSLDQQDSNNSVYVQCQNLLSEGKILFLLFSSFFNSLFVFLCWDRQISAVTLKLPATKTLPSRAFPYTRARVQQATRHINL